MSLVSSCFERYGQVTYQRKMLVYTTAVRIGNVSRWLTRAPRIFLVFASWTQRSSLPCAQWRAAMMNMYTPVVFARSKSFSTTNTFSKSTTYCGGDIGGRRYCRSRRVYVLLFFGSVLLACRTQSNSVTTTLLNYAMHCRRSLHFSWSHGGNASPCAFRRGRLVQFGNYKRCGA